jgi:hypothetical protein
MHTRDSYQYIHIGLVLRLLRNVAETNTAKFAATSIETLKELLQQCGFRVVLAATESIQFDEMEKAISALAETDKLGAALATKIKQRFKTLEPIVFAEASTKMVYVLSARRFNSNYLLSRPDRLMKSGSFAKLDEIARLDLSSACRCILFGEATAAAFHMLRATESVLKSYYLHHRKKKRLNKPMWADMVNQLRAKKSKKPPAALLQSLDLIRTAYRNPTQHPEAVYKIDSAQDLLGVCLDAIGKMADEL